MKTYEEIVIAVKTSEARRLVHQALERLQEVEGLERSLVAQAAERAERQGGVEERSREGKRVAPVKAEALLRQLTRKAAECREQAAQRLESGGSPKDMLYFEAMAAGVDAARMTIIASCLWTDKPEPESEAEAGG